MKKDTQFVKFASYGFLKNLRFFEPFIILFFREQGLSFLQIGTLFSVREIAINFMELPTGIIADLYGRRISMVLSMVSYIVSFLSFYFFPNFYVYIGSMVLFALGEAFRTGTHKAMILEYLRLTGQEDKKVEYYGATRSFSQLGSAINSLIAAALVFYSGTYKMVFLVAVVPYIINLLNLATYPKALDGDIKKTSKEESIKAFFQIFKHRYSLKGLFNSALFDSFYKTVKEYLQPILESTALALPLFTFLSTQKRTSIVVGLVYFVLYLLTSYASRSAWKVSKLFGSKEKALNITYILGAFAIILAGVFDSGTLRIVSILLFILLFVVENARRPMNIAYLSDTIAHTTMASGLSAESQLKTLIGAALAPILGLLADKFSVGMALVIMGLGMLSLYIPAKLKQIDDQSASNAKSSS
ncbi:MFS transporter [Kosmotoga arenicorallina S304]|uniref:MFS transporter n=1 Tax=Kosmotoga arenicorallina S304 TaxID=1453497 RepID=A0A176JYZ5_9BACT|nr:MFS transporter [Kosmotoga arenicorallina]OAA29177.1 MFS transporter [Kosmotoga arenicorallina S304]